MTRRVLLTGVSGGIGSATAARFKEEGWTVVGVAKDKPKGDSAVDHYIQVDLASSSETINAIEEASKLGPFHALVNNAGMQGPGLLADLDVEVWDAVMGVNLRAAFLMIKGLYLQLKPVRGCVVNVASVHAEATSAGAAAYATSKGGLVALTRAAALELAPAGIRVNAVSPGAVATMMLDEGMSRVSAANPELALKRLCERTPLGRVGQPAEIAEMILFLSDPHKSSFVTGQAFVVDGGAMVRLSTE